MKTTAFLALAFAASLAACTSTKSAPAANPAPAPAPVATQEHAHAPPPKTEGLEPYSCGTVERLHTFQGLFLASQPAEADLRQAKEGGIKTVLSFRPAAENKAFDEPAFVRELGLEYVELGYSGPDTLTDALLDDARALLRDQEKRPMMVHCHSGNRVGAIWLAHRVLDGGLTWEAALAEAKQVGLKTPALEARVKAYVDARKG